MCALKKARYEEAWQIYSEAWRSYVGVCSPPPPPPPRKRDSSALRDFSVWPKGKYEEWRRGALDHGNCDKWCWWCNQQNIRCNGYSFDGRQLDNVLHKRKDANGKVIETVNGVQTTRSGVPPYPVWCAAFDDELDNAPCKEWG